MKLAVIVLCAGKSTRMKSSKSKIFQDLCGLMVIEHVEYAINTLNAHQVIYVVSESIKDHEFFEGKNTQIQKEQLGTADAIKAGLKGLDDNISDVLILCGDTPLIQNESLKKLCDLKSDFSIIAMELNSTLPYGRIVVSDDKKYVKKIVEYKDANEYEKLITLLNASVYKIKKELLTDLINRISNNNKSSEFYATDMVALFDKVEYVTCPFIDFIGINDMSELDQAQNILQSRYRLKHQQNGVNLIGAYTTFFSFDTKIESDVTVEPYVIFKKGVKVESFSVIKSHSVLENVHVGRHAQVGPFASIRGDSYLGDNSVIGNFVEVKNSNIGKATKAKHLSYIGDTTIGYKTNIGAGVITANYNGYKKFKTTIKDHVSVGANSTIVAPVTIEDNSMIAAGTVVTKNVPKDSLAIGRAKVEIKKDWVNRFAEKNKK